MQERTKLFARTAAIMALAVALQSQMMFAGNRLVLKKGADNTIDVELSNTDAVAGAQFSITARGGLVLRSFEASERLKAAGIGVYQALHGDSTLNIVLLAPFRASLPSGEGAIGNISFTCAGSPGTDSIRVLVQRVVFCDVAAQLLEISAANVSWSLDNGKPSLAASMALEQNFPNPFNPSTTISYRLERPARVQLAVYDVAGRMVNLLVDEEQQSGRYSVRWNTLSGAGSAQLASGVYIARLNVGGEVAVMKMLLTK